ncbi:hypothetical protein ZOSMA_44G00340 [Zostera marina]|uniref:Uncharacterized protein n=1 Tax=Zostera marina TaxID=29655 RepID=A0A0K9P0Z4_ZOSMR|nr:hypothetical protein ZOSMA_44G00340 [Zostera marina]
MFIISASHISTSIPLYVSRSRSLDLSDSGDEGGDNRSGGGEVVDVKNSDKKIDQLVDAVVGSDCKIKKFSFRR